MTKRRKLYKTWMGKDRLKKNKMEPKDNSDEESENKSVTFPRPVLEEGTEDSKDSSLLTLWDIFGRRPIGDQWEERLQHLHKEEESQPDNQQGRNLESLQGGKTSYQEEEMGVKTQTLMIVVMMIPQMVTQMMTKVRKRKQNNQMKSQKISL